MKKIKVKGKWQYFDGERRIIEAEYNALMEEFKKSATKKEKLDVTVETEQE